MSRVIKWFIGVDTVLVVIAWLWDRTDWLLNTQIAFFSSALVLAASMFSYSQMVYSRLSDGNVIPDNERDAVEKIEDPYDLYGEDTAEEAQAIKDAIKEEKQRIKQHRRSLTQVLKDSRASLSFIRLGAYLLLFVGFFYLSKSQWLHIPSYLLGLTLPIVIMLGTLMSQKEEIHETGL